MIYGLIVEGTYDTPVFRELLSKLYPGAHAFYPREMGGVPQLLTSLRATLRELEVAVDGNPVEQVLVMRDADRKNPAVLEAAMAARIAGFTFTFPQPIGFHAIKEATETWLLADPAALNHVAHARGGEPIADIAADVEQIPDPKTVLGRLLRQAGLQYTAEVCREIAALVDLETLRDKCQSFRMFSDKVAH